MNFSLHKEEKNEETKSLSSNWPFKLTCFSLKKKAMKITQLELILTHSLRKKHAFLY